MVKISFCLVANQMGAGANIKMTGDFYVLRKVFLLFAQFSISFFNYISSLITTHYIKNKNFLKSNKMHVRLYDFTLE